MTSFPFQNFQLAMMWEEQSRTTTVMKILKIPAAQNAIIIMKKIFFVAPSYQQKSMRVETGISGTIVFAWLYHSNSLQTF